MEEHRLLTVAWEVEHRQTGLARSTLDIAVAEESHVMPAVPQGNGERENWWHVPTAALADEGDDRVAIVSTALVHALPIRAPDGHPRLVYAARSISLSASFGHRTYATGLPPRSIEDEAAVAQRLRQRVRRDVVLEGCHNPL
jgi:hypothetical protein